MHVVRARVICPPLLSKVWRGFQLEADGYHLRSEKTVTLSHKRKLRAYRPYDLQHGQYLLEIRQ